MKETPIFEEVFTRLVQQPGFWRKMLVGGLLSFIPVVNFIAFGYLYRLSGAIRRTGGCALPEWDDLSGLFTDGLRSVAAWLGYWLLPVLLAFAVGSGLHALGLGALAYVVCSLAMLGASVLFSAALYRLQIGADLNVLLDPALIFNMSVTAFPRIALPALVFSGIVGLLFPLYGFAFFGGSIILITCTSLVFRGMERRGSSAA